MTLILKTALVGWRTADMNTKLTSQTAHALRNDPERPVNAVLRYVPLPSVGTGQDLDAAEVEAITGEGLAIGAVQHVRYPGWNPAEHDGAVDGAHAAAACVAAGLPSGTILICDLEGVVVGADPVAVGRWASDWYTGALHGGCDPCLYVGDDCGLSGSQLYQLPFARYMRSLSAVPDIPGRGYQIVQAFDQQMMAGMPVDLGMVQRDHRGSVPRFAAAAA